MSWSNLQWVEECVEQIKEASEENKLKFFFGHLTFHTLRAVEKDGLVYIEAQNQNTGEFEKLHTPLGNWETYYYLSGVLESVRSIATWVQSWPIRRP